jgi:hypothetical protein
VAARLKLVLDLAKDLANLVLNRPRPRSARLEVLQIRKQLLIDEVAEIVANGGAVVIEFPLRRPRDSPCVPSEILLKQETVRAAIEFGLLRALVLQRVQVLQK